MKKKKGIDHDKETTIYRNERRFWKFSRPIEFPEKGNQEVTKTKFKGGFLQ